MVLLSLVLICRVIDAGWIRGNNIGADQVYLVV